MCSVLTQYQHVYDNSVESDKCEISNGEASAALRYDIITSVLDSGLRAAAQMDSSSSSDFFDGIWDRIIATVDKLLLPSSSNRYTGYAYHSKDYLRIVAIVLDHLPKRKHVMAEPMLENGADRAVAVAFECNGEDKIGDNELYSKAADGAVHVFLSCFMGLCQKMPSSPAISSLTNQIIGDTLDSEGQDVNGQNRTRLNFALAVCESLRTTPSQDLLISLFPLLCQLTNASSDSLRMAAGRILSSLNLSEAISRERARADEAERRANDIEEENIAMLEEIEDLQAQNEELERQVRGLAHCNFQSFVPVPLTKVQLALFVEGEMQ